MNTSATHDQRMAAMTFSSVYPHYVTKVEKKGRTKAELHEVIKWLTGFNDHQLQELINDKASFETFFGQATVNPNAQLITGLICGYRVEEIQNKLTHEKDRAVHGPQRPLTELTYCNWHLCFCTPLRGIAVTDCVFYSQTLADFPI